MDNQVLLKRCEEDDNGYDIFFGYAEKLRSTGNEIKEIWHDEVSRVDENININLANKYILQYEIYQKKIFIMSYNDIPLSDFFEVINFLK